MNRMRAVVALLDKPADAALTDFLPEAVLAPSVSAEDRPPVGR